MLRVFFSSVTRVVNSYGPQTRALGLGQEASSSAPQMKVEAGADGIEERLNNIETHLKVKGKTFMLQITYFSTEKSWYFSYFSTKTCCGYSLEVPQRGTSNEYPQRTFLWRSKKNMWIHPLILRCGPSLYHVNFIVSASVAQLDARPTGDQEVAGSTPAEISNILSWRLIMKYFLRSFSPFR